MLKKFLASGLVLCAAGVAVAQSTTLNANNTVPTGGADIGSFNRNGTNAAAPGHWTYDLRMNSNGADWTGSEIMVDVVGAGSIWHASDQRISNGGVEVDPDPNNPTVCYLHNLNVPGLTFNGANNANTRMYDTFFTSPGNRFNIDPQFASPGQPAPNANSCQPTPPVVSSSTRLRGLNPSGVEIPLAWFDTVTLGVDGTAAATLGRLTFQSDVGYGDLEVVAAGGAAPANKQLFATIRGRTTTNLNSDGVGFGWDIYQTPEPSTMALLALGGLAGLIRRR